MLLEKADKKIKLHPCLRRLRDETREQHDTRTLDAAKDGTLYDKLLVESLGAEHEAYEVKIEAERKKKLHKMHSITEFIRPGAYAILRGTTRAMDEAAAEAESNPPRPVHAGPPTAADELIRPVRKRTRVGMTAAQKETIGKWIAVHGNNPSPHDYDEINALPGMDSVGRPKLRKYFDNKRNRKQ